MNIIKTTLPQGNVEYQAWIEGDAHFAGHVILTQNNDAALVLFVREDRRRQGVATALYDHIEKDLGYPLKAAPKRSTPEQKLFRESWENSRKQA